MLGEPFLLGPPGAVEANKPEPIEHLSDKQIIEKRLASYQLELKSEVRKHQQELIKSPIAVFICLPLFFYSLAFCKAKVVFIFLLYRSVACYPCARVGQAIAVVKSLLFACV